MLLQNENTMQLVCDIQKMNMYHGVSWNGMLIQQKKNTIRNEIQLDGINQFSTPVLTDNRKPISANGLYKKKHTILVSG
jgi:hypothetical protein